MFTFVGSECRSFPTQTSSAKSALRSNMRFCDQSLDLKIFSALTLPSFALENDCDDDDGDDDDDDDDNDDER